MSRQLPLRAFRVSRVHMVNECQDRAHTARVGASRLRRTRRSHPQAGAATALSSSPASRMAQRSSLVSPVLLVPHRGTGGAPWRTKVGTRSGRTTPIYHAEPLLEPLTDPLSSSLLARIC